MTEKATPCVSIFLTTYMKFAGIYKTLDSIFAQKNVVIELIVSDDGSPNWSEYEEDIVSYIEKKRSQWICNVVINHLPENLGTVKNCNSALKLCNGKYVKGLGPGDEFVDAQSLQEWVCVAEKLDADVVFCPLMRTDINSGEIVGVTPSYEGVNALAKLNKEELLKRLCLSNCFSSLGMLIKKQTLINLGGFDERYKFVEDWSFGLKLLKNNCKLELYSKAMIKYETGGISSGMTPLAKAYYKDMKKTIALEIKPYDKWRAFVSSRYNGYFFYKNKSDKVARLKTLLYSDVRLWNIKYKIIRNW